MDGIMDCDYMEFHNIFLLYIARDGIDEAGKMQHHASNVIIREEKTSGKVEPMQSFAYHTKTSTRLTDN